DGEEHAGFALAIVAVKNVGVERVDEPYVLRPADQGTGGEPTIKNAGRSAHRTRVCGMGVNDVGAEAAYLAIDLPKRNGVFKRQLAAHLLDVNRPDAGLIGEVDHVLFAPRHGARDEPAFDLAVVERLCQPCDVACGAAD